MTLTAIIFEDLSQIDNVNNYSKSVLWPGIISAHHYFDLKLNYLSIKNKVVYPIVNSCTA